MKELEKFDISLEEFDELTGEHVFSKQYQQQKRTLLKEYRKSQIGAKRATRLKVAAASVAVLVSTPLIANAALNGELFNSIWGNEGKKDIEAHEVVIYDETQDPTSPYYDTWFDEVGVKPDPYSTYTYPENEFVEVDAKKADELIGAYMGYPRVSKEINGTTLTIESVVRDKNAAVVYYTLENENGVDALAYDDNVNEIRQAWVSEYATFQFHFDNYNGYTYVDLERSTGTKLYCYDYMKGKGSLDISIEKYPSARGRNYEGWHWEDVEQLSLGVPKPEKVPSVEFVNAEGGIISVSPISITIYMSTGLGLIQELDCNEALDPASCYYVAINYKDGTKYTVQESENMRHECEVPINNTYYACGGLDADLTFLFNRLVDVNEIESIVVNDTVYIAK